MCVFIDYSAEECYYVFGYSFVDGLGCVSDSRSYSYYYNGESYPYPYNYYGYSWGNYYGPYYEYEEPSYTPLALFGIVSFIMQIASVAVYTMNIHDRVDGTNYKGMLIATQLTWGMTSFSGMWAYFGGANSLDLFWNLSQMGFMGTLLFNWLGLFWAQYKRETESETALMDGNNQVAMGLNILFNITTFAMHLWL